MKSILLSVFGFFLFVNVWSQNVNFDWVAHFGEAFWAKGNSVAVDFNGNVYSTGEFSTPIDFDPGPATFMLPVVNNTHCFISKLDANRNFIWAKQIEGLGVRGLCTKTDAFGNVLIIGTYAASIDLDPGAAVVNGIAGGNMFIIKLNSAGDFIWGKSLANTAGVFNVPFKMALDFSGELLITGMYGNQTDFDPGPSVVTLPSVSNSIDVFILKLSANGDFIWVKGFGTQSSFDLINAVATDVNGNVCVTGIISGNCDFDPGVGVYNINNSSLYAFVLKLDANGNFIWAKHFNPYTTQSYGTAVAIDASGNVYCGGGFFGLADFDPDGGTYNLTAATQDCYICKLDGTGKFIWAKSFGAGPQDALNDLAVDNAGSIFATGTFYLTVDFDPGPSIFNLNAAGLKDIFITKLNAAGSFNWAKAIGGSGDDNATGITIDTNTGSVYTIGGFENTADFDPGLNIHNQTSLGFDDIFLLKLNKCANNTSSTINAASCQPYILNSHQYDTSGSYIQVITNSEGCDSIITLNLTINRKFSSFTASICQGQSYFAGGANQTTSGIYKDTLQTSLGCDSIITTTLTVQPKPVPNLGADRNLCTNTIAAVTPGVFNSYIWQDNSTQPNLTINTIGKYWVTVTDANNCTATDTLIVLAIDTLPKNFLPADKLLCTNSTLKITVPGYKTYLWSSGPFTNDITVNAPGQYWLEVTDNNNCKGIDTMQIIKNTNCIPVSIPNAFTPNRDGINDLFRPVITLDIASYKMSIFNRYGEKIFETDSYIAGWDGTYKGAEQPRNSYVYLISCKDKNGVLAEYKGTVTLIR